MRIFVGLIAVAGLAACADTSLPDSGAHLPTKPVDQSAPLSAMIEGSAVSAQPLDAPATPGATASAGVGISDEQDFQAVSSRESIESDAARIAANKAQYQQVEPTALPSRPGGANTSIVNCALNTTNVVGQSLYKRTGFGGQKRFDRNCLKYGSPDLAQQAFLNAGGPKRDKYGIDPDGDGFACGWNPAPFRNARPAPAPQPVSDGVSAADLQAIGITGAGITPPAPSAPAADPLPGDTLNISTE